MRDASKESFLYCIQKAHRQQRDLYCSNPAAAAYRAARPFSNMASRGPNSRTAIRPVGLEKVSPPKKLVIGSKECHLKHGNIDRLSTKDIIVAIGGVITSATGRTAEPQALARPAFQRVVFVETIRLPTLLPGFTILYASTIQHLTIHNHHQHPACR